MSILLPLFLFLYPGSFVVRLCQLLSWWSIMFAPSWEDGVNCSMGQGIFWNGFLGWEKSFLEAWASCFYVGLVYWLGDGESYSWITPILVYVSYALLWVYSVLDLYMNDVSPYFRVEPTWHKDQDLILWLMGCLSVFLLSLSMVSGHKAKALWPMASPMTLSSNTCYGLFLRFLQWNSRLSIQIVVSLCKLRFCSSLEQMGWYACSCMAYHDQ